MTDALALRPYRVTFLHIRTGVRWEILVDAPTQFLAHKAGDQALAEQLARTVGHPSDWVHYSTAEATQ